MDPLTRMSAIRKENANTQIEEQTTAQKMQQIQNEPSEDNMADKRQERQDKKDTEGEEQQKKEQFQQKAQIKAQQQVSQIVRQQALNSGNVQLNNEKEDVSKQLKYQNQKLSKQQEQEQGRNASDKNIMYQSNRTLIQNNVEISKETRKNMIQINPSQKQFSSIFGQKQQDKKEVQMIRVQINSSHQIGTGLSKSTQYHVQGQDKHGPFMVNRTYQQFQSLRAILYQRWPGCFIPSIDKQNDLKSSQQKDKYIRYILKSFIVGLSYSPHVYYREQIQMFLRTPDINIIEMCEQMPPLKTRDVIGLFISNFGQEFQRRKFSNVEETIRKFIHSLRKISNSLMIIAEKVLGLVNSYQKYAQSISKFGNVQKKYEQFILTFYASNNLQKTILVKDNDNKIEKLQTLNHHNPFFNLYACINSQSNDAQAFRQIIIASQLFLLRKDQLQKQIRELQSQIQDLTQGNKKSIKLVASRKTKQQYLSDLNDRLKKIVSQKETMLQMFRMLQGIIVTESIPTFKTVKRETYRKILKQWTNFTTESCSQLEQVWAFIYQQSKQYSK